MASLKSACAFQPADQLLITMLGAL